MVEQNYECDLLSPAKLLDKCVGKKVTHVLRSFENQTKKLTPTEVILLANNGGAAFGIGAKRFAGKSRTSLTLALAVV